MRASALFATAILLASIQAIGTASAGLVEPADHEPRWQALENKPSCEVWNTYPRSSESANWDGPCVEGRAEGEGVLTWRYRENGDWHQNVYEGAMENGRKHGQGTYVWEDESRYEGEWADGKADGYGSYTSPAGNEFTGSWSNGCFHQGDRWATVDTTPAQCGF